MALLAMAMPATAFEFQLGRLDGSLSSSVTLGASWRTQDRAPGLIGKSNLNPSLCTSDARCTGLRQAGETAEQIAFRNAPGSYSLNGDDGDFDYAKWSVVAAVAKITSDLSLQWRHYGIVARASAFYDPVNSGFVEQHPNRATGPAPTDRAPQQVPRAVELRSEIASDAQLYDAYAYGGAPLWAGSELMLRVGNQQLHWGESTFIVVNSLDAINPIDFNRLYAPGSLPQEVYRPLPMVDARLTATSQLALEGFYALGWRSTASAVPGSFFSTSDVGVPGGQFASLAFGGDAEDPLQQERFGGIQGSITQTSETILRQPDRPARGGGQYGAALKLKSSGLDPLELRLYYAQYHSNLPLLSLQASQRSCLRPENPADEPPLPAMNFPRCRFGDPNAPRSARDALPVDTAGFFFEFPEDIRVYGISWNGAVGSVAIQGEYAFRPNLPVQVDLADLSLAAVRPALPRRDTSPPLLASQLVIPGQDTFAPDLVETRYRGNADVKAGQYIRGYERLAVGQFDGSATLALGRDNPFGASRILLFGEFGFTHIRGLQGRDQIVFAGPGNYTSPLPGRKELHSQLPASPEEPGGGDVTAFSWGYRLLTRLEYPDLFGSGLDYAPSVLLFHDVSGIAPSPSPNFVAGRKQLIFSQELGTAGVVGSLGYNWFFGGGAHNLLADRDFLTVSLRVDF